MNLDSVLAIGGVQRPKAMDGLRVDNWPRFRPWWIGLVTGGREPEKGYSALTLGIFGIGKNAA